MEEQKKLKDRIFDVYEKKYKLLIIIPLILLLLALTQIGFQMATTGDFLIKDVSLKGGVTVTVPFDHEIKPSNMLEDKSKTAKKVKFPIEFEMVPVKL